MGKSCAQKGFFLFDKKNIKSSGKIFLDFFELFRNWWLDSWLLLKNIFFDGIQHNSQAPTLCYFWHPSDFFYRTKLSWHVQNDFLIKLNISRSAFLKKKVTFHFLFWRWLLNWRESDLFTLVGYSFVRKNCKTKNQITVGKIFSRATKWDYPRFFIFFGLEVTAFSRYTTAWWLLDFGHSNLFTLVGFSFARKNLNIKNQMTVGKIFSRATKWDHSRFFLSFFG